MGDGARLAALNSMSALYLGTQGWSYDSWVGSFYPSGTGSAKWLEAYAREFNSVELDTTFYAIPSASTVKGWQQRTPADFRFAAKFPQVITHEKGLINCGQETEAFLDSMAGLGTKLGPLLLQMPPSFGPGQAGVLTAFLMSLPRGFRYALEIRHRSWLTGQVFPSLLSLLQSQEIALCLVQHSWMPRLDELTAPFTYIRWLGRRSDIPDTDYSRLRIDRSSQIAIWAEQIARYLRAGVAVYGYFNNHYQGHSPASVRALQSQISNL